jgi:hypothetical protein
MLLGLEYKVASILQLVVRYKCFLPNGQMITYAPRPILYSPECFAFISGDSPIPDHFPAGVMGDEKR